MILNKLIKYSIKLFKLISILFFCFFLFLMLIIFISFNDNKDTDDNSSSINQETSSSQAMSTNVPNPVPTSKPGLEYGTPEYYEFMGRLWESSESVSTSRGDSKSDKIENPIIINDDPESMGNCYVEKDGTFWMTTRECMELHDKNPEDFRMKAYQNCLGGKNPNIGDEGTQDERKQQCADMFGIKFSN